MRAYIYALTDPETGEVRYIGKARDPRRRLGQHLAPSHLARCSYKNHWLTSLLRRGLRPQLLILQEVSVQAWSEAEQRWIAEYRADGARLTNLTDGGEGVIGHVQPQYVRDAVSAANRRRPMTEDRRVKLGAAGRARWDANAVAARLAAIEPCARCADPSGTPHPGGVVPGRITGVRFGFAGDLCRRCYGYLSGRVQAPKREARRLKHTGQACQGLSFGSLTRDEFISLFPFRSNPELAGLTGLSANTVASRGRALGLRKERAHRERMQDERVAAVCAARAAKMSAQPAAEMIVCACGCGGLLPVLNRWGRPTRYMHGHNGRGEPRPAQVRTALSDGLKRYHAQRRAQRGSPAATSKGDHQPAA